MHTLLSVRKDRYCDIIESLAMQLSNDHDNTCYISFNNPYNIVVNFLSKNKGIDRKKFVVIDASDAKANTRRIDRRTYVIPTRDLFKTYLTLRNLIVNEGIEHVFIDSLSALIYKFGDFPLNRMLSDLLLEIGSFSCDSSLVVFDEHRNHDVIQHLSGFIGERIDL